VNLLLQLLSQIFYYLHIGIEVCFVGDEELQFESDISFLALLAGLGFFLRFSAKKKLRL